MTDGWQHLSAVQIATRPRLISPGVYWSSSSPNVADVSNSDSYTAREAGRVIGRSERLVRRLAADGRLEIVGSEPLRVSMESVHRERAKRKTKPDRKPDASAGVSAEQLEQIIARAVSVAVAEIVPRMLESRDASESRLVAELANAQQQIDALRRELEEERTGLSVKLPPLGWPFRR